MNRKRLGVYKMIERDFKFFVCIYRLKKNGWKVLICVFDFI